MFKKTQQYLLVNHPLLWNILVVPATVAAIVIHIVFFALGFAIGEVDFSKGYDFNIYTGVLTFFTILITVLFFVVWFIFYTRNNAFKSYYPLRRGALYKEWLIILLICILNVTYSISLFAGKSLRIRNYYSYEETVKRSETIAMASVFIGGVSSDFEPNHNDSLKNPNGKYYAENSLINKSIYFDDRPFRSTEATVKQYMIANDTAAIKKIMRDYFTLIKEHQGKTNLTVDKWFALTYNYPHFVEYEYIARQPIGAESNSPYVYGENHTDATYYLPHSALSGAYSSIYKAWDEELIDTDIFYALLYTAFAMAMLLFSYKVTNGRSWLFALITIGVFWIFIGILGALSQSGTTFLIMMLIAVLAFLGYFIGITTKNKGKEISDIVLNLMLWTIVGLLPIIYSLVMIYYDDPKQVSNGNDIVYTNTPQHEWLNANMANFSVVNLAIILLAMYLITVMIKRWKGIADS